VPRFARLGGGPSISRQAVDDAVAPSKYPCLVASDKASNALTFDFSEPPGDASAPEPPRAPEPAAEESGATATADVLELAVERAAQRGLGRRPAGEDGAGQREPRIPGSTSDDALTVAELYDRVQVAIKVQFPDEVWVTGEIRKVTVARNGHRYIELADHRSPGDGAKAGAPMVEVACWSRDWPTVAAELDEVGVELTAGLVVRVLGRLSVWTGGSRLRLSMTALDVEALVGGIAAARRRLLRHLEAEGLLDANRRLPVPLVPLRVGVVTSAGSEAYNDFTGTLGRSGLRFAVRLEHSLVQGMTAPPQIAEAIRRLHSYEPDVIVIVRGGGGRGDLAAFDSEEVARAIASSRIPVWTGIGHTGDRSVADEVAQRALVTPTACAEALCEAVQAFCAGLDSTAERLVRLARQLVVAAGDSVERERRHLATASCHQLDRASDALGHAARRTVREVVLATQRSSAATGARADRVCAVARQVLRTAEQRLGHERRMLDAFDPRRQLARGWSLTRRPDGTIVRSVGDVEPGSGLTTVVADGTIASVVSGATRVGGADGAKEHESPTTDTNGAPQ